MKQAKHFILISITKKPISIANLSPFGAALLSAPNANKSLHTWLFWCTAHPKESLGFQVKTSLSMTSRLSRIPGGTQLMSSLLTFSLPGNICCFQCFMRLLPCLQNADMFRWQAGALLSSLFWRHWWRISVPILGPHLSQQNRIHKNLWTFHPRQGPAGTPLSSSELLQTVQNCLQLQHPPKGCCSSWGLPEFTDGSSLAPGQPQLHPRRAPPCKAQQEGAAGTRLLRLRDIEEFPCARQRMQARDLAQHCCFWIGILPPHTLLSLKESCHVLDNPKLSVRRNSGKHFLQRTAYCEYYLGFKNSMSSSFPQMHRCPFVQLRGWKVPAYSGNTATCLHIHGVWKH